MKRWCIAFVFSVVFATSVAANAQPADDGGGGGKADATKASKAFEARSYRAAAEGYESAFAKMPNYAWLFNAARARQRNGDLAKAANEYARFVNETPPTDKQHAVAKKEIATLASKLGRLEIKATGATSVTVDGEPVDLALSPTIYVTADAHLVEAHFGSDETVKESATTPVGQITNVVLARSAAAAATTTTPTTEPEAAEGSPKSPIVIHEMPRERPVPPLAVWIGGGAAVVFGGLTIVSGIDVLSQKDTFDTDRSQENLDSGKDKQIRTNILLVTTVVVAAVTATVAIFFVDWKRAGKPFSSSSSSIAHLRF